MSGTPVDTGFYAMVAALARSAQATRLRLAAHGVRCDACFTLALRPEVVAMRAAVARVAARTSGLAQPARSSGLAKPGEIASGTAPTEPALAAWPGPLGGKP